ncbi:TPA: hypothetical protein QFV07_002631 [Enterococcus faecium]
MKKTMLKVFVGLFLLTGIGGIFSKTVDAGSYYYDKSSGNYVINVTNSEIGKNLNSIAGKTPGSVTNKMRNAAIKRYGSIQNNRRYYFSYKNIVTPYGGKKGGVSFQWTGRVINMNCTGRS